MNAAKRVKNADPNSALPQDVLTILESVIEERDRAMAKFGVQNHPDGTGGKAAEVLRDAQRDRVDEQAEKGGSNWKDILLEEVREAFAETDLVALDNELMQVMQVCCVWREDIARRQGILNRAVTVSARSLVDSLEKKVEAKVYDSSVPALELEMRSIAGHYPNSPALRSLAQGSHPGRRWMIDNVNALLTVGRMKSTEQERTEMLRLLEWVKGLPDSWWDVNFTDEQRRHDEQVEEALAASRAKDVSHPF